MKIYSIREAAEILGYSRQRVDQWVREGAMPYDKLGKYVVLTSGNIRSESNLKSLS